MRRRQWQVAAPGVIYCREQIAANVLQHRRAARDRLLRIIRDQEKQITAQAGQLLPLRVPRKKSAMWDYLPDLQAATNGFRFFVRYWCGTSVSSRQNFWGYDSTNCGLDELLDALGYWHEPAAAEGESDAFGRFVTLVEQNRSLRGRGGLYGMLSNGVSDQVAALVAEDELERTLLVGTCEEATDWLVKELSALTSRYTAWDLSDEELDFRRSQYHWLAEAGETEESFLALLTEFDQRLVALTEPIMYWQTVVAQKLGVCANFQPQSEFTDALEESAFGAWAPLAA